MEDAFNQMELRLQNDLTRGWEEFLKHPHYQTFKDFALFLDDIDEFQTVHRNLLPHPPHEFAARFIGKPLMNTLMGWGFHTSCWFPGDYYDSAEIEYASETGEEVHARVFSMDVLYDKGQNKLCQLTFTFPHLHDGFGFLQPVVKISERYASSGEDVLVNLSKEVASV
jgi:hypothetical protein